MCAGLFIYLFAFVIDQNDATDIYIFALSFMSVVGGV